MKGISDWKSIPAAYKCFAALTIALAVYLICSGSTTKEGFEGKGGFSSASGSSVYDTLYASMYDPIFVRKERVSYELDKLYGRAWITKGSHVLDVGCGTGHLCGMLTQNGVRCTGMDRSKAMITKAQEEYPKTDFVRADATLPSHSYYGRFDAITCLYFTFYEMKDKKQFLENCYHWLKPGGRLLLHKADPSKFDPILPVGNVLINVDPQDYSENKITTTRAVFENKEYKGDLTHKGGPRYVFVETILDRNSGNVKRLERELLIPRITSSTKLAESIGFNAEGGEEMTECGYGGQYIYVFQKPE